MHYCYILRNHDEKDKNRTYNGYTVNPRRRIRQHNGEIAGGAKYTKIYGNQSWEIFVLMKGFPDHHNALQCEWRIKHPDNKRRLNQKYRGPKGRVKGLCQVLSLDKWTNSSTCVNKDMKLDLWIIQDYVDILNEYTLPDNINVNIVDKIDLRQI